MLHICDHYKQSIAHESVLSVLFPTSVLLTANRTGFNVLSIFPYQYLLIKHQLKENNNARSFTGVAEIAHVNKDICLNYHLEVKVICYKILSSLFR